MTAGERDERGFVSGSIRSVTPTRRTILGALPVFLVGQALAAGAYPDRPVKIVVPIGAAGSTDVLTRLIAERIGREMNARFVIENRPGAGGNTGMLSVARSEPDGYVLASATVSQFVINPLIYKRMPYDPRTELTFISILYELANVLVVSKKTTGATTFPEFVKWARARSEGLNFSSAGVGTSAHLLGELLGRHLGVPVNHIAFRGNVSEAGPAMLRGDVHFSFDGLASWLPFIQDGEIVPLLVNSRDRSPVVPDVPTVFETGMDEFSTTVWAGIVGPANLPNEIRDLLSEKARFVCGLEDVRARIRQLGAEPLGTTSAEMAQRAARDHSLWARMVQISGVSLD